MVWVVSSKTVPYAAQKSRIKLMPIPRFSPATTVQKDDFRFLRHCRFEFSMFAAGAYNFRTRKTAKGDVFCTVAMPENKLPAVTIVAGVQVTRFVEVSTANDAPGVAFQVNCN